MRDDFDHSAENWELLRAVTNRVIQMKLGLPPKTAVASQSLGLICRSTASRRF